MTRNRSQDRGARCGTRIVAGLVHRNRSARQAAGVRSAVRGDGGGEHQQQVQRECGERRAGKPVEEGLLPQVERVAEHAQSATGRASSRRPTDHRAGAAAIDTQRDGQVEHGLADQAVDERVTLAGVGGKAQHGTTAHQPERRKRNRPAWPPASPVGPPVGSRWPARRRCAEASPISIRRAGVNIHIPVRTSGAATTRSRPARGRVACRPAPAGLAIAGRTAPRPTATTDARRTTSAGGGS